MDKCRVCENEGSYDIFTDELSIENNKTLKIYVVLNNFFYEKLYAPDEHSSSICQSCFENLHNSYRFMLKVRDSEKKKEENPPPFKKLKQEHVEQINDAISIETIEVLSCGNVSEEEEEEGTYEDKQEIIVEHVVEEKTIARDYVTFNQYILECRENNNQKHLCIRIGKVEVKKADCKNYAFVIPSHTEVAIYSCLYCIKAFGNLDILIKHVCSCHLCNFCLKTFKTYNEITEHSKAFHQKNNVSCPFCSKTFNSSTFRAHIKKQHITQLPQYVHISTQ